MVVSDLLRAERTTACLVEKQPSRNVTNGKDLQQLVLPQFLAALKCQGAVLLPLNSYLPWDSPVLSFQGFLPDFSGEEYPNPKFEKSPPQAGDCSVDYDAGNGISQWI